MISIRHVDALIGQKFFCQGKQNTIVEVAQPKHVEIDYYFTNVHFSIKNKLNGVNIITDSSGYEFGDGNGTAVITYDDYLRVKDKIESDSHLSASITEILTIIVEHEINGQREFNLVSHNYHRGTDHSFVGSIRNDNQIIHIHEESPENMVMVSLSYIESINKLHKKIAQLEREIQEFRASLVYGDHMHYLDKKAIFVSNLYK
jgi:hypothetical protein